MSGPANITVLHYTGAENDRGGIMSVVHALAATRRFECVLGTSPGFAQKRCSPLPVLELPRIAAETIGVGTWWRARAVAATVKAWLRADSRRVFHGHSRAGLVTALRLVAEGEQRVVVSVHCYGRQRWYYRRAAEQLGTRLFWLTPAMKRYYGFKDDGGWSQCVPSCIADVGEIRSRVNRPRAGVVRVGGAGMMVAWKGWHLVLEALAKLSGSQRERIRFTHIGSAVDSRASRDYVAELRARTAALGLSGIVDWRGEEESSSGLLQEIDVLVVPSSAEPFSVVMLEALRAGVPVLASRAGGPTDVLQPPRNGWFFAPEDSADLARALVELIESDALDRVEINAKDLEPYSAERVAAQWADIYAATVDAK